MALVGALRTFGAPVPLTLGVRTFNKLMRVFISHISEESPIATCLKDWIESTLLGQCEVFVSSDSSTLPGGVKWLTKIDEALKSANVMLVICSAASIARPWVNFETGCAWSRNIPVVPLCHSGMQKGKLPRPISDFQALDLTDQNSAQLLLEALQAHFGLAKLPRINNSEMQSDIALAIAKVQGKTEVAQQIALPVAQAAEARDEGNKILHFLGQRSDRESTQQIAVYFQWSTQQAQFFIDELTEMELIRTHHNVRTGTSYSLNEKGRKYLFVREML